MSRLGALLVASSLLVSCGDDDVSRLDAGEPNPIVDGGFVCFTPESRACLGEVWNTCEQDGEFLRATPLDCASMDMQCVMGIGCSVCRPDTQFCRDGNVVRCNSAGDGFDLIDECDLAEGNVCRDGSCQNLCDIAIADKSYQGCEFYAADLDNAAIGAGRDASAQQYAIVVSNPSPLTTDVWIEINNAAYGEDAQVEEVTRVSLPPGDLEVFALPRREVDGSSSNQLCTPSSDCPGTETCVCGGGGPPCFCRVSSDASGLNDGTHTALSSQAYRVRSQFPIIAYQFNPLDNVGVFSNDASLLIPTSAISTTYTVVGWPQTIADADCDPAMPSCRDIDFNPAEDDEDLRAFLTILGGPQRAVVDLTLGTRVVKVLGNEEQGIPAVLGAGAELSIELGPFDVLNLETDGLNGDFTGTRVEASMPVGVFVGSEASDAPRFDTYATRQCCADHLEEQLFGDEVLGTNFMIARMPRRTTSLNAAFVNPLVDSVAEVNEPEWVRVVAVANGQTTVTTTLPPPEDRIVLEQFESIILRASQDFLMNSLDGKPVAVLQTLPSQQAVGIPNIYPGGDPAIVAIPPTEQYRRDYVFLTPDQYAFDYVVITANADTEITLDGRELDPLRCETAPADGIERMVGDPPPEQVIHRCQLSFPDIGRLLCDRETDPDCEDGTDNIEDGEQNDGVHTVVANDPVGIVVYGFDAFVSYAYAAGLNLKPIPR
ncbi:MAG: IgGFc-binding protein [Myxococcota bacterium]